MCAAAEAINEIANSSFAGLRVYAVARNPTAAPQDDMPTRTHGWQQSSYKSVGSLELWDKFSAVCYFFGREVHTRTGLPVGLIASVYGGTRIEAWMSPGALARCPGADTQLWVSAPPSSVVDPNTRSVLYYGQLAALQGLPITAAVWYQGESNLLNALNYSCLFPRCVPGDLSACLGCTMLLLWLFSCVAIGVCCSLNRLT